MSDFRVDYQRQLDIFSPSDFVHRRVEIIGAGGIGSFTAIALAKLGLTNIRVWDADLVESHNLPNQLHLVKALGSPKVASVRCLCKELAGVSVDVENQFWAPEHSDKLSGIVVAALDHVRASEEHPTPGREELWKSLKCNVNVELLIDARIGGQTIRLISMRPVNDIEYWQWYEKQLFESGDEARLPCTARAVIDVGFIVGGLVTNVIRRYLKDGAITRDLIVDLSQGIQVFCPEVEIAL